MREGNAADRLVVRARESTLRLRRCSRSFAIHHSSLLRILVLSQAAKRRMPQQAIARAYGELHLRDELRPHPMYAAPLGKARCERALRRLELGEHRRERAQLAAVEPRPDLAGVDELP